MKNKISHRRLSRTGEHRTALFRALVTSLVQYERIRTTIAKAKEVQRHAEKVITWAKEGSHQYHVKATGYLRSTDLVKKLFSVLGPRYKEREGGYTRILRAGFRRGDRAEMAIIEYVDRPGEARVAKPPAVHPVVVEQPVESIEDKLARLIAKQKLVAASAASQSVPTNLLPAFPLPSSPPLKFSDLESLPVWQARRARAEEKVAAARRRKSKRSGGRNVVDVTPVSAPRRPAVDVQMR